MNQSLSHYYTLGTFRHFRGFSDVTLGTFRLNVCLNGVVSPKLNPNPDMRKPLFYVFTCCVLLCADKFLLMKGRYYTNNPSLMYVKLCMQSIITSSHYVMLLINPSACLHAAFSYPPINYCG